jgi:serine/threonine protein kinase
MKQTNWTTRFLVGNAQNSEKQPDGQGSESDSADAQVASAQPAASRSLVGSRVGTYLISKRLGEGGVGEVFKGVDVMLKREVAIKVLHPEFASDPIFVERFSREAQLHAQLSHPNIATVHAFLHEGDNQFMVMEYVAGISLDEFVRSGGPVPVARALSIFRRALDGIEHAHRNGIVHRDIKPANIMVADSGAVKVMDFGIARALDSQEHLTRHGQVAGTAKAMSPEQIRGAEADVRSDIYSLGIVLYTLLAGRAPFDADSDVALMKAQLEQAPPPLRALAADVPPEAEAAVMRALEKDPAARFQSVAAFAQAIDACLAERAKAAAPAVDRLDSQTSSRTVVNPVLQGVQRLPSSGADGQRAQHAGGPRRKWPWLAGAGALGVVVLGLGVLLWPPPLKPTVPRATVRNETAPNPTVDAVKPRTLAIVRLPSGGPASSTGGAAEFGAAGSAALQRFKPGELIRLRVVPSQDAHVYCYLQDESRRIVRFYPNRFNTSALVRADAPLEIPGAMRFELVANSLEVPETIACFASERDVAGSLPPSVFGDDFSALPAGSLDEVRQAFARAATDGLAEGRFQIGFK